MTTTVSVTDRAYARISRILATEPGKTGLRVAVSGGGCSGFQYEFDLVQASNPDDLVMSNGNASVLIDEVSLPFLAGCEIDFVDGLMGNKFEIRNPNATASCGCGTSFAM
jgi:iron-sulfur cluster assembly accessory protein